MRTEEEAMTEKFGTDEKSTEEDGSEEINTEESGTVGDGMTMQLLNQFMLNKVAGGTDYSYAYDIISRMISDYQKLLQSGTTEANARNDVKSRYWSSLLDICKKYPENGVSPEKQAEIIFMFTIGS